MSIRRRLWLLVSAISLAATAAFADPVIVPPSVANLTAAVFAKDHQAVPVEGPTTYTPGAGVVRWTRQEIALGGSDTLRLDLGESYGAPGLAPLGPGPQGNRADVHDVTLTHAWPRAAQARAGGAVLSLTPHAGLGVASGGGSTAEAGATLSLSLADMAGRRYAEARDDQTSSGLDESGVRLFASASGRAVGLNMFSGQMGFNAGSSTRMVGDIQAGLGWRSGVSDFAMGFLHRSVKGAHVMNGVDPKSDSEVGISVAIRPRWGP